MAISLNRTFVNVGVAEHAVVVGVPVLPGREKVFVAVAQSPVAELPEQLPGRRAAAAPHEAGMAALRALRAVKKAAYDQVRSTAESGVPFDREYCSARAPFCGVYFCAFAI